MAFSGFEFALPELFFLTLSKIDDVAAPRVNFDNVGWAGKRGRTDWGPLEREMEEGFLWRNPPFSSLPKKSSEKAVF